MIKTAWKLRGKIKAESQLFTKEEPPPPTYPLSRKSFFQKTLSGNGGYPGPPLNRKSAKLFRNFVFLEGLKMMFFIK